MEISLDKIEAMLKPTTVIEDCENCGEEGYGKCWYGKGAPNDPHGYGDAYHPTGSVVFCKDCWPKYGIGRVWNAEEIWKQSSDRPEHDQIRVNSITKSVNKEYNQAITDVLTLLKEET